MNKIRRIFISLVSIGTLLLLAGCKAVVLDPKGIVAADEKDLLITAVILMLIVVIPVILFTFIIARRYRASNKKAKYSPNWSHSNILEIVWWSIPCAIIVALAMLTWIYTHRLDPYRPLSKRMIGLQEKPMTIEVVALRWKWLFIYPKQKIATINYIEIPVNQEVQFKITDDAPMNSFQIPQLGGQIYAMNGMRTRLHLIANKAGVYDGRSVNFSGNGFADMTFKVKATSKKNFKQWVNQVKSSNQALDMEEYNKLVQPTKKHPVTYYRLADDNLFHKVIQKFLTPNRHNVDTSELGVHL